MKSDTHHNLLPLLGTKHWGNEATEVVDENHGFIHLKNAENFTNQEINN